MAEYDPKQTILEGIRESYQAEIRAPQNHPYVYASGYHPCVRYLYHTLVHSDTLMPFRPDVMARFERGNYYEEMMTLRLKKAGRYADPSFDFVRAQERFEIKGRSGDVIIVGKIDGMLRFVDGRNIPVEFKSWKAHERLENLEDVLDNIWYRSGGMQLLTYLLGFEQELGYLVLDTGGIPKLIPVTLMDHLTQVETFLVLAEYAVRAAKGGFVPKLDPVSGSDFRANPIECRRCKFFGGACNPDITIEDDTKIITDNQVLEMIETIWNIKDLAQEYNRTRKKLAAILKEQRVTTALAGDFVVQGKWGRATKYEIPKEIKEKYKVVNPEGRYTFDIVATTDDPDIDKEGLIP